MTTKIMGYICAASCFVCATYLIANGFEYGWGWLIFIGALIAL